MLELVEMEVRDLLTKYDFPGDDIPVIRGSALKALEGEKVKLAYQAIEKLSGSNGCLYSRAKTRYR